MYKRSLKENTDEEHKMLGPGSGAYYLKSTVGMPKKTDPTFWQSPAFSLRRLTKISNETSNPGPKYKVDRVTRHGTYANTKIPIGQILKPTSVIKSPGPAAYFPCYPNLKHSPTPKILFLPTDMNKFITPAPNAYMTSSIKSSRGKKGYTIKWRTQYKVGELGTESPGPAAYDPVNVNMYRNQVPPRTFGMRIWTNELVKQYTVDRPHTYSITMPECAKSCRRRFTFGVRHSKKSIPYVLPADNSMP